MQKCGATKAPLRPSGWECTGTGLVIVMLGPEGVPVVIPETLLSQLDGPEREIMDSQGGPRPFPGGDHLHLRMEAN